MASCSSHEVCHSNYRSGVRWWQASLSEITVSFKLEQWRETLHGGGCLNIIILVLNLYSLLDSEAPLALYTSQTITELNSGSTAEQNLVKSFEMQPLSVHIAGLLGGFWRTTVCPSSLYLCGRGLSISLRLSLNSSHYLIALPVEGLPSITSYPFLDPPFFSKVNMPSEGLSQVTWPYPLSPKDTELKSTQKQGRSVLSIQHG